MHLHPENTGGVVTYDARFDSYEIAVSNGAIQQIYFCPWCGEHLPPTQRGKWFDELEALGVDPMNGPYPDKFKTDEWRRPPSDDAKS